MWVWLDHMGNYDKTKIQGIDKNTDDDDVASLVSRVEPNIVVPFGAESNSRSGWFDVARDLSEGELTAEASLNISASVLPEPVTTRVLARRVI